MALLDNVAAIFSLSLSLSLLLPPLLPFTSVVELSSSSATNVASPRPFITVAPSTATNSIVAVSCASNMMMMMMTIRNSDNGSG